MLKIAHIINSLDPLDGGPPIVVVRLAAELARQGHDVRIISHPAPYAQQRIDAMIGSLPGANQVRYQTISAPGRFERLVSAVMDNQLAQLLADVQIVHLHGVWDGIPYVVAPHGMLDPWSLSQKAFKKKLALLLGYRAMLNRAAFLHLLNVDERQLLAPLGLKCDTEVIANGISPEEFLELPPAGSFRAIHPELGQSAYILFLSRLHFKKGLDLLAHAFAELCRYNREIRLVVAGRDEGAEQAFRGQIQAAGLTQRVHLVGPIFGKEKLAALVDASCFCLPSRQEGFSIAILEALACGRPVVISDACHFPEVAANHAGGVVPLEPWAIAAALSHLLADPARAEAMGAGARDWVLQQYTWPAIAAQLVAAYERLINKIR